MDPCVLEDDEVIAADGEWLGRITRCDATHFVVHAGSGSEELAVGYDQVVRVADGKVELLVRRDQLVQHKVYGDDAQL